MNVYALILAVACASSASAQAPTAEKHSAVEVTSKGEGEGLALAFKIVPAKDMIVNWEGPWKLDIKEPGGLAVTKATLGRGEMAEDLPGWTVTAKPEAGKDKGEVAYKATVFVCDKDKTRCFREVHEGKHAWAKPAT